MPLLDSEVFKIFPSPTEERLCDLACYLRPLYLSVFSRETEPIRYVCVYMIMTIYIMYIYMIYSIELAYILMEAGKSKTCRVGQQAAIAAIPVGRLAVWRPRRADVPVWTHSAVEGCRKSRRRWWSLKAVCWRILSCLEDAGLFVLFWWLEETHSHCGGQSTRSAWIWMLI